MKEMPKLRQKEIALLIVGEMFRAESEVSPDMVKTLAKKLNLSVEEAQSFVEAMVGSHTSATMTVAKQGEIAMLLAQDLARTQGTQTSPQMVASLSCVTKVSVEELQKFLKIMKRDYVPPRLSHPTTPRELMERLKR